MYIELVLFNGKEEGFIVKKCEFGLGNNYEKKEKPQTGAIIQWVPYSPHLNFGFFFITLLHDSK